VLACAFVGQLAVCLHLRGLDGGIVGFEAHVGDEHGLEAVVAVGGDPFCGQVQSALGNLVIACTADLETDSSDVEQMAVIDADPAQQFPPYLHHLSLQA